MKHFIIDGSAGVPTWVTSLRSELERITQFTLYRRAIMLVFLKVLVVLAEYATPITINQLATAFQQRELVFPFTYEHHLAELARLLGVLFGATVAEYFISTLYLTEERRLRQQTNQYLSNRLFRKCLNLYANMSQEGSITFQGMLKELRQIENATESFYTLVRVFFELIAGGLYLSYLLQDSSNAIFHSLKWGVLVSLLALLAASAAQIYAWRVQYFSDQRLKLTQDIISCIKNIKYLQWEQLFLEKMLAVRAAEFAGTTGIQYVDAFITFFRRMSSVILMFATFYTLSELPSTQFYTMLIFFDKFVYPLNTFPWCFGEFLGSFISLIRINTYLNQMDRASLKFAEIESLNDQISFPQHSSVPSLIDRSISMLSGRQTRVNNTQQFQLNPNVKVLTGKLHMIIGAVGSGKTALLDSLIGEMVGPKSMLPGRVAYVGQNPWIFSGTIRDNILFGNPYDAQRFEQCVYNSDLATDLAAYPEREHKNVGLNGTNLSGGQRQRLAICRALYMNAEKYLLDDILSSVDEHVADLIMQRAICHQLKGRTVLMVLSQEQYLLYADQIIELANNTTNQYTGQTHQINQQQHKIDAQQISEAIPEQQSVTNETDYDGKHNIPENMKFYLNILGLPTVIFFVATSLLQQLAKGVFELWTHSYIFSVLNKAEPFLINNDFRLTFIVIFLVVGFLTLIRGFAYSYATLVSAQKIFTCIARKFLRLPVTTFDTNDTRYFIRRLFTDMDCIDDLPLGGFLSICFDTIALVLIVSSQQLQILPFSVLALVFVYRFQKQYLIMSEEQEKLYFERFGQSLQDINAFIAETSRGLKTIRCAGQQEMYQQRFQSINEYKHISTTLRDKLDSYQKFYNTLIQNGAFLLFVSAIIINSTFNDNFNAMQNSLALTYASMLFGQHSISSCFSSWKRIVRVSSSLQRLRQLVDAEAEPSQEQGSNQVPITNQSPLLVLDSVWLNYQQAKGFKADGQFALKGVSLTIRKGEKVAFCGRTGSGKSSILNLLVRLYEVSRGEIRLEGRSIAGVDDGWTILFYGKSVIPQNGFLFSGSLLQNLNPKRNLTPTQVISFLKQHHLLSNRLLEIVAAGQIETYHIESGGANLSNGEKQIINFVQQVLEIKDIVCMDEATSNMDPQTNDLVMRALFELIEDRTLLLISHKLENLQRFHRIYVLADGQVVGEGTYQELLLSNKYFQELKSQIHNDQSR